MIVEVNGIQYQSIEKPKPKQLSSMAQIALMMGNIYCIGESKPVSNRQSIVENIDIVKEYGLIKRKQSKLSRSQRDYVVWYFEKHFEIINETPLLNAYRS